MYLHHYTHYLIYMYNVSERETTLIPALYVVYLFYVPLWITNWTEIYATKLDLHARGPGPYQWGVFIVQTPVLYSAQESSFIINSNLCIGAVNITEFSILNFC